MNLQAGGQFNHNNQQGFGAQGHGHGHQQDKFAAFNMLNQPRGGMHGMNGMQGMHGMSQMGQMNFNMGAGFR